MPFHLSTLINVTPKEVKSRASKVRVVNFVPKSNIMRRGLGKNSSWWVEYKASGTGKTHTCRFKFYSLTVARTAPVWVWCDCNDFKYREEYVLTKKADSSSSIISAKPNPPKVTNPKNKVRLCKHLLKITQLIPQVNEYLSKKKRVQFGR